MKLDIPLLSVAVIASIPAARAQDWVAAQPANAPTARTSLSLEAEPNSAGTVLLFGGLSLSPTTYLNDTWRWDGSGWTQLFPANAPAGRIGADMVSDPLASTLVLYGGVRPGAVGDTWTWDGTDWTLREAGLAPGQTSPTAIHSTAMAYDFVRGKVVLFGGQSASRVLQDETWEFDVASSTWAKITTATAPAPRSEALMAYDFFRRECVLFGGKVSNGTTNLQVEETWVYDGADWTQRFPDNSPCARSGEDNIAFDPVRGVVVLHAANTLTVAGQRCAPDQTWEWDGRDWYLTHPSRMPRGTGQTGSIAWCAATRSVIHFGGLAGSTTTADTTLFGGAYPYFATFGAGCAGTVGVPALAPAAGSLPNMGGTLTLDITGTGPGFSAVLLSAGTNPLPAADLGALGSPGCSLYLSLATLAPVAFIVVGGSVNLGPLNIPGGVVLEVQCVDFDPGANALGVAVSNAGRAIVH